VTTSGSSRSASKHGYETDNSKTPQFIVILSEAKNPSCCHPEQSEGSAFLQRKEKADSSGKPGPRNDSCAGTPHVVVILSEANIPSSPLVVIPNKVSNLLSCSGKEKADSSGKPGPRNDSCAGDPARNVILSEAKNPSSVEASKRDSSRCSE
jgi:hypothetical protein